MVNHEKNKYKVRLLSKEIEDFVKYLGIEKNYASNTILSYERDLVKFSNFLDKKKEKIRVFLNLFWTTLDNFGQICMALA